MSKKFKTYKSQVHYRDNDSQRFNLAEEAKSIAEDGSFGHAVEDRFQMVEETEIVTNDDRRFTVFTNLHETESTDESGECPHCGNEFSKIALEYVAGTRVSVRSIPNNQINPTYLKLIKLT